MKLFERGSVTVFLTLILIPSIIITAVFFDGARIKLYNNQAIMAADSYAEAVLSEYDNLLKELYGVFAVSQDEKGKAAIGEIRDYIKTSFNPAGKTINNQYDPGFFHKKVDGFMPYSAAEVKVGIDEEPYYETIEDANLYNPRVLGTQIGDFMRYRIVKEMLNSDGGIVSTIANLKNVEANSKEAEDMNKIMDKAREIINKQAEFYKIVSGFDSKYTEYLKSLNKAVDVSRKKEIDTIGKLHKEGIEGEKVDNHPFKNEKHTSNSEFRKDKNYLYTKGIVDLVTGEDYEECFPLKTDDDSSEHSISDSPSADDTADSDKSTAKPDKQQIKDEFYWYVDLYKDFFGASFDKNRYGKSFDFRIDNYEEHIKSLTEITDDIKEKFGQFEEAINELTKSLNNKELDETLKNNIESTLELYKKLSKYKPEVYYEIKDLFQDQISTNQHYENIANGNIMYFQDLEEYYFYERPNKGKDDIIENKLKNHKRKVGTSKLRDIPYGYGEEGDKSYKFKLIKDASKECQDLYSMLNTCFADMKDSENAKNAEEDAKKKKKEAEEEKKKLEEEDKKQTDNLKNIPSSFELNDIKSGGLSGSISDFFKNDAINALLTKIYTVSYDLGMFSNRVDKNLSTKEGEEKQTKESITGYDMSKLNYIYGAELEYLFGGSRTSKDNLNDIRNSIFVFREGMNLASTFMIQEVNAPINNLTAALMWAPPIAVSVNAISRLAIATAESVADWKLLMAGKKIVLLKAKLSDSSIERLVEEKIETAAEKSLSAKMDKMNNDANKLSKGKENFTVPKSADKPAIEINYSQLVTIMILLFVDLDTLVSRTGNLICVNVNNALYDGKLEDGSEQKMKMKEAYTAVKGTCSVKLDYLLLPNGYGGNRGYEDLGIFTQKSIQKDTWDRMKEVEQNDHKFSVIRGY